ncbi:MAG TPA: ABC transporter ATP-binding protein [Dehalococcoidia bacterium]|nr:ABC transporter ATP-binding protein [Dehalococcoidia bacterium]
MLALEHVSRDFNTRRGQITAVDDVSLQIDRGDILCLVGESGSGKTTVARMASGLLEPTRGTVLFEGRGLRQATKQEQTSYRRAVQLVHQDPYASLNPVRTIGDTLRAPLLHHKLVRNRREATVRAAELLTQVDLTPPHNFLSKYPHQLSGGQRQRVAVARALALEPRLIIADEAVSMVDVSIRVSILNTMLKLRNELGVAFLFITHDLAVVKYFGWEGSVGVMYVGKLVEYGRTPQIIGRPLHPYAKALAAAIPEADPDLTRSKVKLQLRSLEIPNLASLPSGCVFHPRCPYAIAGLCDEVAPILIDVGDDREAACHVVARERGKGAAA